MAGEENKSWRHRIFQDLQARNKRECETFALLISSHNRLLESSETFRSRNNRLQVDVEKLKTENEDLRLKLVSGGGSGGGGGGGNDRGEKTQMLEQKVYKLQDELTELHRKKGENAQQLIDLSNSLKEKEKQSTAAENRIRELEVRWKEVVDRNNQLEQHLNEEATAKQCLMDELQALQMAYAAIEKNLRDLQEDNADLVTRWMAQKADLANRMNAENETFRARQHRLLQEKIDAAAADTSVIPSDFERKTSTGELDIPMVGFVVSVPSRALQSFEGHEGEVNAVRWGPSGRMFASGGSDRKVKLWELRGGKCETKGVLIGSNAGVMSVEFDTEETLVLAASNDFACRVWTCSDLRLRSTLTGHSGKALAAKFLNDSNRVVSGSHDRTLKLWDLRSIACTRTIFAGSSCNDIVVLDGSHVISGHFDKTVRFWDTRGDTSKAISEITLNGRVTSLDLSADKSCLLACARDETVSIIDLKSTLITAVLCADGFRTTTDWSRAVFSPDAAYVSVGSADGGVYIWEVASQKVHSVLKEHHDNVLACAWNPNGRSLLSCDKHKTLTYWSDI